MSLPPTKDLLFRSLPKGGIMSNLKQELMLSFCLINSLSSRQMRAPVHTVCLSSECLTPPGAIARQLFSTVNEVKDEKYS